MNSTDSPARSYWENRDRDLISAAAQKTDEISVPVAITAFWDRIQAALKRGFQTRAAEKNLARLVGDLQGKLAVRDE